MNTETYIQMKKRHQDEFNKIPLRFAFTDSRFIEIMEEWGLDWKKDLDKIVKISGGGFIKKEDVHILDNWISMNKKEMEAFLNSKNEKLLFDMFVYELNNNEYGYTGDVEDTLDSLDIPEERLNNDIILKKALIKACKHIQKVEMG